ncbi:MAG: ABC transporter ATP-binding protein [Firmicutes bacterium]|nr:ABC transporter ATP-binding protein [Bacillota bacterium]
MILKAEGISKRYFRNTNTANYFYAVKKTDLPLFRGELTAITGRSGSGKSTLLNMLGGLLSPTEGRVLYDGRDIYALPDKELSKLRNAFVGIVPQGQSALSALTVLENVMLPYYMYKKDGDIKDRAGELLERVGILSLANAYPNELSGGENRRLAIARALIHDPDIILADEPTGDLDDENTKTVLELLRAAADDKKAVLLVTHENDALSYADRVYRMNGGELTECEG